MSEEKLAAMLKFCGLSADLMNDTGSPFVARLEKSFTIDPGQPAAPQIIRGLWQAKNDFDSLAIQFEKAVGNGTFA